MRSLALMPLLRPDVIKLDLRLVQERPSADIAEIVSAVGAERERSGAAIVAEGIETEEHLRTARALGASLGQGWLFGRPAPSRTPPSSAPAPGLLGARAETLATTPFEAVAPGREVRSADKRLLLAITLHIEQQARAIGAQAVLLSAFQEAKRFTPATVRRYESLAAECAFVAAFGVGMAARPAVGVRGARLDPDDALRGEWSVVVLGPHFGAALVAVDLGDEGPDMERRFDYVITHDRQAVVDAARTLMRRVERLS